MQTTAMKTEDRRVYHYTRPVGAGSPLYAHYLEVGIYPIGQLLTGFRHARFTRDTSPRKAVPNAA
jgi:hypothetical protein